MALCSLPDRRLAPHVLLLVAIPVLATLMIATAGCRSSSASASTSQISMRLVTEKKVGQAVVEATVRSTEGHFIGGAKVTLRGDMNHAGMKPVIVQMVETSSGTYLADDFQFTMAGDWLLTIEAVLPGGDKVDRTFEVTGVVQD